MTVKKCEPMTSLAHSTSESSALSCRYIKHCTVRIMGQGKG